MTNKNMVAKLYRYSYIAKMQNLALFKNLPEKAVESSKLNGFV